MMQGRGWCLTRNGISVLVWRIPAHAGMNRVLKSSEIRSPPARGLRV